MKKAGVILLLAAAVAAGTAGYRLAGSSGTTQETMAAEQEGRSRISARIVSVVGNQLTYRTLSASAETTAAPETAAAPDGKTAEEKEVSRKSRQKNGEKGGSAEREKKSGSEGTPGSGSASGGTGEEQGRGSGRESGGFREKTQETGVTVYIPVSAPVYSDTGKKLTFTVLQAGDTITIQTDRGEDGTEVITGIWLNAKSE